MTKVKICGITNLEDGLASYFAGADALGFIFYKKSPRYISPLKAQRIARLLPKHIARVGVFVNAPAARVKKIAKLCGLDMLQFHGQEGVAYCRGFKNFKVIKVFRIRETQGIPDLTAYKTYAFLFDTYSKKQKGGTGRKFDWKLLQQAAKINLKGPRPKDQGLSEVDTEPPSSGERMESQVFLSGGLTAQNVRQAVCLLKPDWVDVSTSLEIRPGQKSHLKIKNFIRAAKQAGNAR